MLHQDMPQLLREQEVRGGRDVAEREHDPVCGREAFGYGEQGRCVGEHCHGVCGLSFGQEGDRDVD